MIVARVLGGCVLALACSCVLAHAHLEQAQPADGSVLSSAPADLVLRFSEKARLTALWIRHDGGARQKVTPLPGEAQTRITVALPALTPGSYVISWRLVSADGHVVPGQIRFTLSR